MVRRAVTSSSVADAELDPHEIEWFYLLAKYYRFRFPPGPVSDAELAVLTAPTLLLMGEGEPFFPIPQLIERARRHLPNLQAEVVAGVGHNLCSDDPNLINARLRQFFAALSAGLPQDPLRTLAP
jgi:pimeloyl-ACP methyl ester carboxylesterase